jgi:hypothetical protein
MALAVRLAGMTIFGQEYEDHFSLAGQVISLVICLLAGLELSLWSPLIFLASVLAGLLVGSVVFGIISGVVGIVLS